MAPILVITAHMYSKLLHVCYLTFTCQLQNFYKPITVVRKFFDRKYFIDKKFKVKYFRGCMTSSKYFYREHKSLAIIYTR